MSEQGYESFPRAWEPWEPWEDRDLERAWYNGTNVTDLAAIHGRTRAAIEARLWKWDLILRDQMVHWNPDTKQVITGRYSTSTLLLVAGTGFNVTVYTGVLTNEKGNT